MKVVLVVIDAASPRVVCPAIQDGRLATLHRLAEAGSMHQASATIFPSITPAATTSIVTGCYPREHGIAGASWFDEARQEVAYYGDDFWIIAKEGFGAFLRDFLVRLNGDRLTAPTLFELVERSGRSAACLNYLVYRGLVQHRVHVPSLLALLPGVPMTETVDGPQTLCLGQFVSDAPLRHRSRSKAGLLHRFGMDDDATAELLLRLVEAGPLPDFTVAYFADNDYVSHDVGPHSALPVVERVDRALGEMFEAAGGLDRFLQQHCVIVTSDHGHCDILPTTADAAIDLQMVLGNFTQAQLGKPWRNQDEIMICPNMRAAQIYARDTSSEAVARIVRACLQEPRVDLVTWKHSTPERTTYIVCGAGGRLEFWLDDDGERGRGVAVASTADAFGTAWRWRGDLGALRLIKDGAVLESSDYPNAFERLAGVLDAKSSGEVWVSAQPGCEFQVPGNDVHVGGGSHGALHALDTLCPVIAAGGNIRLPRFMRSVDVAPLCMAALGLEMRYRVGERRTT